MFDAGDRVRVWCESSKFHGNEGRVVIRKRIDQHVFWGIEMDFAPGSLHFFGTKQLEAINDEDDR